MHGPVACAVIVEPCPDSSTSCFRPHCSHFGQNTMSSDEEALDRLWGLGAATNGDVDADASAALERLEAFGGNGAGSTAPQRRAAFARSVRHAVQKRAEKLTLGTDTAGGRNADAGPCPTFGPYAGSRPWEAREVLDLVFGKASNASLRAEAGELQVRGELAHRVRAFTLFRYLCHRRKSLQISFSANAPLALLTASLRIKWDETEQIVGVRPDQNPGAATSQVHLKANTQREHVMTVTCWWKTVLMRSPMPWLGEVRRLQRTTAECLWKGLSSNMPWSLSHRPSASQIKWLWLVCCADSALSNLWLFAHLEMHLAKRHGALTVFVPCLIHAVHRAVVPLLRRRQLVDDLFRSSHVLSTATYWATLIRRTQSVIDRNLVVVHDETPNAHFANAAADILDLTLCEGLPLEMVSQRTLTLRAEILAHMVRSSEPRTKSPAPSWPFPPMPFEVNSDSLHSGVYPIDLGRNTERQPSI